MVPQQKWVEVPWENMFPTCFPKELGSICPMQPHFLMNFGAFAQATMFPQET